MRKNILCTLSGLAVMATAGASFGTVFIYDFERPDDATLAANQVGPNQYVLPGGVALNDDGGLILDVHADYDDATNILNYSTTVNGAPDGNPSQVTNGFWLVISDGPLPNGPDSATWLLFDASGDNPALSAYSYIGDGGAGSATSGMDLWSSLNGDSEVLDLNVTDNGDSTTFSFSINADGISFGNSIGVWMHTLTNVSSSYSGGFIDSLEFVREGWFDTENQATIPAPGAIALLAVAGLAARRRRAA